MDCEMKSKLVVIAKALLGASISANAVSAHSIWVARKLFQLGLKLDQHERRSVF
jgi:hypothetical protein